MFEGGIVPSSIDRENYIEFLNVMKAKSRDERPMNAADAHKKIARLMGNWFVLN